MNFGMLDGEWKSCLAGSPDARVRILVVLVEISCECFCKPGVFFN